MDELTNEQLNVVEEGEPLLGLERGFFRKLLLDENDWSFVIKTHALIESVLTRLIQTTVRPEGPREFVTTFNLSGGRHSKVALLRNCDLLEDSEAKFVRGLSKIRNRLVHNVRYTSYDLSKFVSEHFSENDQDDFVQNTCRIYTEGKDLGPGTQARALCLETPRAHIWLCALHVAAMATMRTQTAALRTEIDTLTRKNLEQNVENLRRLVTTTDSFLPRVDAAKLYRARLSKKEEIQGQTSSEQKTCEK